MPDISAVIAWITMQVAENASTHVTSHTRDLPRACGIEANPSGGLPFLSRTGLHYTMRKQTRCGDNQKDEAWTSWQCFRSGKTDAQVKPEPNGLFMRFGSFVSRGGVSILRQRRRECCSRHRVWSCRQTRSSIAEHLQDFCQDAWSSKHDGLHRVY